MNSSKKLALTLCAFTALSLGVPTSAQAFSSSWGWKLAGKKAALAAATVVTAYTVARVAYKKWVAANAAARLINDQKHALGFTQTNLSEDIAGTVTGKKAKNPLYLFGTGEYAYPTNWSIRENKEAFVEELYNKVCAEEVITYIKDRNKLFNYDGSKSMAVLSQTVRDAIKIQTGHLVCRAKLLNKRVVPGTLKRLQSILSDAKINLKNCSHKDELKADKLILDEVERLRRDTVFAPYRAEALALCYSIYKSQIRLEVIKEAVLAYHPFKPGVAPIDMPPTYEAAVK